MATRIADYEVLAGPFLGGFGEVYKVFDRTWGDEFALKTLRGQFLPSSDKVARFRREIDLWVQLPTHPHVVRAIKAFEIGGRPYIVMEWVGGGELSSKLGSLDAIRALLVLRQIASAMSHIHKYGMVHGDLKPANVLIWGTLCAQVSDFGFARLHSEVGPIGGTRAYMAPELHAGGQCTVLSDLFAAGILFQQALAKFSRSDFGVATARALAADMMKSEPTQRPQSFDDVCIRMDVLLREPPYLPLIPIRGGDRQTFEERTLTEALPEKHLLIQARSDVTAGRWSSAKAKLQEALRLRPDGTQALSLFADVLANEGDTGGAIRYLQAARVNENNPSALFNLAVSFSRLGQAANARQILDALPVAKEIAPLVWQLRGELAEQEGDLSESIDCYRRAVSAGGGAACSLSLARILGEAGLLSEAIDICHSIDPQDREIGLKAQVQLARLYLSRGGYDHAIQTLRNCLRQDLGTGAEAYVHSELGYAYMQQKLYEPAVAHFKKSLALDPAIAVVTRNLQLCEQSLKTRSFGP